MTDPVFRVDVFRNVSKSARTELLEKVNSTHAVLREQPGFVRSYIVERPMSEGDDRSCILRFVEWRSHEAVKGAAASVQQLHADMNFRPAELFRELQIDAELTF